MSAETQRGVRDLRVNLDELQHVVARLGDFADGVHGPLGPAVGQFGLVSDVRERRAQVVENRGGEGVRLVDASLLEAEQMVEGLGEGGQLIEVADGAVALRVGGGDQQSDFPRHVREGTCNGPVEPQQQVDCQDEADGLGAPGEDHHAPERPDARICRFAVRRMMGVLFPDILTVWTTLMPSFRGRRMSMRTMV